MKDHLQSVGKGWRIACAIASTLAAVLFLFILAVLCAMAMSYHGFHGEELGMLAAIAILLFLAAYTSCIAWQLWRGRVSRNRVTTIPTGFIQVFGVFFLLGSAAVAISNRDLKMFGESIAIGSAMIFVGRNIARRKNLRK